MPCFQCGRDFTLLNREAACKGCNKIFCSKCLKYKTSLPKFNNKVFTVCFKCYDSVMNPVEPDLPKLAAPKILMDRLAAAEMQIPACFPVGSAGAVQLPSVPPDVLDQSVDNLTYRLDKLKGVPNPGKVSSSVNLFGLDEVPSQEELEERLRKLKERDVSNLPVKQLPDSDKVEKLVEQLTAEAKIDLATGINEQKMEPGVQSTEDELPWCCICNRNAQLRCVDCDGDLFCQSCYRRTHQGRDMKRHQTISYGPSLGSRCN
ncbi:hypothetical protein EG68_05673 [Paragonimus skrjabini miyazakii]|uniref:FYVE-type domain-containing protein n=1 Tax=Paragonimus skrjabini miyazakii TaxID=59628 RepID=A0A8S9YZH6_9TREM|nr:hypothetical protein EG68_05673 [Paragonimus skrjabini miyazakii]